MRPAHLLWSALALGWLSTAAAQEVLPSPAAPPEEGGPPEDIPDNMDEWRRTPLADPADAAEAYDSVGAVQGRVVAVTEKEVWVKEAGRVRPLAVTPQTRVEPAREEVLRAGAEVRAQYAPDLQGRPVATRIEAVPAAPPAE